MSNNWEPDQAHPFVGPSLGPNCLQKLSTDNTSRQRVYLSANKTLSYKTMNRHKVHVQTIKKIVDKNSRENCPEGAVWPGPSENIAETNT